MRIIDLSRFASDPAYRLDGPRHPALMGGIYGSIAALKLGLQDMEEAGDTIRFVVAPEIVADPHFFKFLLKDSYERLGDKEFHARFSLEASDDVRAAYQAAVESLWS